MGGGGGGVYYKLALTNVRTALTQYSSVAIGCSNVLLLLLLLLSNQYCNRSVQVYETSLKSLRAALVELM